MGTWAKKHHKLVTLAVTIIICAILLMVGTGAWNIVGDQRENDAQLAGLQGSINTEADEDTLTVGSTEDYKVTVENTSDSPAFVRVMVLPVCEMDGVSLEVAIGKQVDVTVGSGWIDGEDGYYYYTGKLVPGEESEELFSDVVFQSSSDIYTGLELGFVIKAEFVGITKYAYRDAWWQGQTPVANPHLLVDTALQSQIQT